MEIPNIAHYSLCDSFPAAPIQDMFPIIFFGIIQNLDEITQLRFLGIPANSFKKERQ